MPTRLLALAAVLLACQPPPPPAAKPPQPEKHYAAGSAGLRELWLDILAAARRDDREWVHQTLSTVILTDDELVQVFGPELGAYVKQRYQPMIARFT